MQAKNLRGISFFHSLSESELETVLKFARALTVTKGQEVIVEGKPNSSLYLVEEGNFHVQLKVNDREMFVGKLEQGGFFGEISLFDPGPATASVRALSGGLLYEIPHDDFAKLIEQHPKIACNILQAIAGDLARRFRQTDQRLVATNLLWGSLSK